MPARAWQETDGTSSRVIWKSVIKGNLQRCGWDGETNKGQRVPGQRVPGQQWCVQGWGVAVIAPRPKGERREPLSESRSHATSRRHDGEGHPTGMAAGSQTDDVDQWSLCRQ